MNEQKQTKTQFTWISPDKEAFFNGFKQGFQSYVEEFDKLHAPYWNARTELVKTLISLSSASIVVTVTFSNNLLSSGRRDSWRYFLFGSWISFLLSVVSAVMFLWLSTRLKTIPTMFLYHEEKIKNILNRIDLAPSDASKHVVAILGETRQSLFRADKWGTRWLNLSIIMFILALVLLGLFGWRQFAA
jgi:hypothetical protein